MMNSALSLIRFGFILPVTYMFFIFTGLEQFVIIYALFYCLFHRLVTVTYTL